MRHFKWVKNLPNGGTVYSDGKKIGEYGYRAYGWEFRGSDGRYSHRHLQRDLKQAVERAYHNGTTGA